MIDLFSREEFETYLDTLIQGPLRALLSRGPLGEGPTLHALGVRQGEYAYRINLPNNAWLWFRSSIDESGYAAPAGQDSIRVWVGDYAGQGLLHKQQNWVTREFGWRDRLTTQVNLLLTEWDKRNALKQRMKDSPDRTMMAKYDGWCPVCRKAIEAGEPIALRAVPGKPKQVWVHFECPTLTLSIATSAGPGVAEGKAGDVSVGSAVLSESLDALADFFARAPVIVQAEEAPEPAIVPSKYQEAIYQWIEHGSGNGVVDAVAGSGKTFTLVQALNHVPPYITEPARFAPDFARDILHLREDETPPDTIGVTTRATRVAFLAFNTHIKDALLAKQKAGKIPAGIRVSTLHSLGLANLTRVLDIADTNNFIDKTKLSTIMDGFPALDKSRGLPFEVRMAAILRRQALEQLITLCKGTMVNALEESCNLDKLLDMADHYGIDLEGIDGDDLELVHQILERCASNVRVIDFDDMCWLPVQLGMHLEQFDFLFIDEAQDLNAVQIELVLRSVAPGGRVLAVGDPHQSLYGFRGADTEAMPRLIERLHATLLPLSICYRCPASHIAMAQMLVPQIEARPGAPEGTVANVRAGQIPSLAKPGDMIICRTNAPLVPLAYALIRKGVKATVRGREIGKGLVELINKFQAQSLPDLASRMREYLSHETLRLTNAEKYEQLQTLQDRCETIEAIAAESQSIGDLRDKTIHLFSDEVDGVVLSSIHRAKGLEAKRVFLLRPDLVPHPMAKQGWQKKQELNAQYVWLTRSQDELLFVEEE